MKRRNFIQLLSSGMLMAGTQPVSFGKRVVENTHSITILHTNDWHSRIEPFPMDGSRNQGLGGASKRSALIKAIRKDQEEVLLFDSGDIFQGTPYFNFYNGELEFKLMSEMGYDAATIGNHDFDAGIENLSEQISKARFSMLNANYDFGNHAIREQVAPYKIFNKGEVKVGVFGLGIELDGLVPQKLYGDTKYQDPVIIGNKIAEHLKKAEKCDLVICLSHLGYRFQSSWLSDDMLARKSRNIDIILGGHSHTFMKEPAKVKNLEGNEVIINQVGWAGILLGRIDVHFEKISGCKWSNENKYKIG